MNIEKLADLSHAYARLGWAVQEQLADLLEAGSRDEGEDMSYLVNANAARLIAEWAAAAQAAGVDDADILYRWASEIAGL